MRSPDLACFTFSAHSAFRRTGATQRWYFYLGTDFRPDLYCL